VALCAHGRSSLCGPLRYGVVPDGDELPVLLALSDNGPQMTSKSTKAFLAGARIDALRRPATPNDQAWIESLFGHVRPRSLIWRRSSTPASWSVNSTPDPELLQHGQAPPGLGLPHPRRRTPAAAPPSASYERITSEHPRLVGYYTPALVHWSNTLGALGAGGVAADHGV
jgi:transposase InsO family protein